MTRVEKIHAALAAAFSGADIAVQDDSHLHAGHAGAATGRGHFSVRVVTPAFEGLSLIARHRAVYAAVDALMQTDIHALVIDARPR
ncbi:MAG: BolA family protein [Pseudomonadota bacterium]